MSEEVLQPTASPASQQITITVSPGGVPQQVAEPVNSVEAKVDGLPQEVTADTDALIPKLPYYSDPLFYEVASYFGLKQEDYDGVKNKLSDIVEYVIREIKSNKPDDIIPRLREIENSIGNPGWDERRYNNFHKYIRLADKKATIGKMMRAYEKDAGKEKRAIKNG